MKKDYDFACSCAKETAEERYHVDLSAISSYIDLGQRLALYNVKTGNEMQKEKGSQADWAIVGGITAGLSGGVAGVAAALDTMRKNEEATKKHHEQGRRIAENGLQTYEALEKNRENIFSKEYDGLIYSEPKPELIHALKVRVLETENYDVGYINATVKITAKRDYDFIKGQNKKVVIDGSVRVDLYDGDGRELLASGYYIPRKTGFDSEERKTIVLKEENGKSFNKNEPYQVKLSNQNLWLLQLKR